MESSSGRAGQARRSLAPVLIVVEAGSAVLGVWFHHGMTAEYGDVTDLAGGWNAAVSSALDFSGPALFLVVVTCLVAVFATAQRWVRATAVAIPVLMVVAVVALTPVALQDKLESAYDDVPRCVSPEDVGLGPGVDAARESQRAFESFDHVGHFGGGGSTGVGGCDQQLVLVEDAEVLQHYRTALPAAGWRVVEDDSGRLRAERDDMAFEVVVCAGGGGVVWAGEAQFSGGAQCRPEHH